MSVDRKMMREEMIFLGTMIVALALTCIVIWLAHG